MSWSRKGALLGAIAGILVVIVVKGGGANLWHLLIWPMVGSLSGWAAGKIISK